MILLTHILNLKKYKKNRYLLVKFEDIHTYPKEQSKKICSFLKIKTQQRMLQTSKWPKYLKKVDLTILINQHMKTKKNLWVFYKKN